MKHEAAIYLPVEIPQEEKPDYGRVSMIKNNLEGAFAEAHIKNLNIDIFKFSKNLSLQGKTELIQRYAVGAISKIINHEPVTYKSLLDALFNTYAPAFNATLEQTGYNSIAQMIDAAKAGNINVPAFLTGFSNGLNALQEEKYSYFGNPKYGEEIPIDIVTKCDFKYHVQTAEHPTPLGKEMWNYIKDFGPVEITVNAHVKNECAEAWAMNDFSNKIVDAMIKKQYVIFKLGKTIYEDVIIEKYEPSITNIHDISFRLYLKYGYNFARESRKNRAGFWVANSGIRNKEFKNLFAETEYIGEGRVEKVNLSDTTLIGNIKKALGRDKIIIDGQEV